jgi:hypothetical protein
MKLAATCSKAYKLYLVKWEGLSDSDKSWIIESELFKHNERLQQGTWNQEVMKF